CGVPVASGSGNVAPTSHRISCQQGGHADGAGAASHRSTRRAPRAIAIAVRRERGMPFNVTRKLIGSHLVSGEMTPGEEIAIQIDQTLTQDATGTLVMQELEALGLDRVRTEVSVQYVDHNLLQTDEKNAEDHEY